MKYLDKKSLMLQVETDLNGKSTISVQGKIRTKEDPEMFRMVGITREIDAEHIRKLWKCLEWEWTALENEAGLLGG